MSAKRRIVHLISSLESGGCENMLSRTLPLLNDNEYEQIVITLFRPGSLAAQLEKNGVRVVTLHLRRLTDFGGLRRLIVEIAALQPSLVLTYLFHADLIGRLYVQQRIAAPVVPFLRTTYNFARYWPARLFEWITRGFAHHYLANSQSVKAHYTRHFGVADQAVTVIPNGIDVEVFDEAEGAEVVQELALPDNRFVVTCVANLAKNKGHRYLLEAFEQVLRAHPNAWLLLVGEGAEERALRSQIEGHAAQRSIIFLGRRSDVPNILAASDVFVLPTFFEGMSNAVQEAMAARLSVVTTDIPENKVLITHRDTGLLVPTQDTQSLAAALMELADDQSLRSRLGSNARQTIEGRFGMPTVLSLWRNAFDTRSMQ